MSILPTCIIASITRFDFCGSGSLRSATSTPGTICQERPYLSLSRPHWPFEPSAESFSHRSSNSACDWQSTVKEAASLNLKCGPPLRARNSVPSRLNPMVSALPPDHSVLPIFEFLNSET